MKIENENTFRTALNDSLNLFVGSGFSTLAKDSEGRSLPIGSELCDELTENFNLREGLNLMQVSTILKSSRRDEFQSYLKRRFTVSKFDPKYRAIEKIKVRSIFTTNIDNLIHEIYKNSKNSYINDLDLHGAKFIDRNAIDYVALHGNVLHDTRELTFEATELASASFREPDRWHYLSQALETAPTLFCGYSLADSGTLTMLHPDTVGGRKYSDKWITVLPGTDEGTVEYFRVLGFQIIECEVSELLDYFSKNIPAATIPQPQSSTRELFPNWSIPDIGDVPARPIRDYFRGAPPTWYDVYSGQLTTTSHHARVRDALNSNKHTFITGIPGSGKTTLMMQVIKDFRFPGHKLLCDAPTVERAVLILNRLEGENALVCIDNFADDLDGVNVLFRAPNVQILGCDDIYWLETVSHRLPRNTMQVIDITDLTGEDEQTIIERIPNDVRVDASNFREREPARTASIFEVVEANTTSATLSERYKSVLQSLEHRDVRLLEFLMVCSYVHGCRTPVSTDMLIAFFRDTEVGYSQFDEMRNRLRGIVVDYLGDLDDGAQDYYSPRSTLVSRAIINQATSRQLKTTIARFHEQVSPYRIHRYDVFKRRAYDHELMRKVFVEWEEGLNFYRDCYSKENNVYILQQGALYLSGKRRFQEAFQMIDESLAKSDYKIPSIRNSHATILFRANINRPETNGIVKKSLQESMEILEDCYTYDRRKAYHAHMFAEQSLQYDDRYGAEESQGYLETALKWLGEERRNSPWHREVARLYRVVARRLGVSRSIR